MDNELNQANGRYPISAITATLCDLMAIPRPKLANEPALDKVIESARKTLGGGKVEKCLVYCPDAVGTFLFDKCRGKFEPVLKIAPIRMPLRAVYPPKTPVCFASMFTGAEPKTHGITQYERPVLKCDTLFDSLVRAGKKTAIVAVADSSIDIIFRGRDIDYFTEKHDEGVTKRVSFLLDDNDYDFILAYHQEYDDALHATSPESEQALKALDNHISSFTEIAEKADNIWKGYNRTFLFAPDHGAHLDPDTQRGDHNQDIAEDMNVEHFFGFAKKG